LHYFEEHPEQLDMLNRLYKLQPDELQPYIMVLSEQRQAMEKSFGETNSAGFSILEWLLNLLLAIKSSKSGGGAKLTGGSGLTALSSTGLPALRK
jgi:hypothetical protein